MRSLRETLGARHLLDLVLGIHRDLARARHDVYSEAQLADSQRSLSQVGVDIRLSIRVKGQSHSVSLREIANDQDGTHAGEDRRKGRG